MGVNINMGALFRFAGQGGEGVYGGLLGLVIIASTLGGRRIKIDGLRDEQWEHSDTGGIRGGGCRTSTSTEFYPSAAAV